MKLRSTWAHWGQTVRRWPAVQARLRVPLLRSRLLAVECAWQRDGDVRKLIAGQVADLTALLGGLSTAGRDFH